MKTYPIMLDVRDKCCVVIGAGGVGLRKVRSLLSAGAKVRLVDPEPPPSDADLGGVEVITGPYAKEHLAGAMLVFACTDDRQVNVRIAQDARTTGALVNAADQPEDCDFFAPATISDGDVIIAIGTGGSSPGLAAYLRKAMEPCLPQRIGEFAEVLQDVRKQLHKDVTQVPRRMEVLKELASEQGYNAFVQQGKAGLQELLQRLLRKND